MDEQKNPKDTAIFFRSFLNAIELIPSAEEKALAYKTLIKYALDGTLPETASTIVNIIFMQAKPQIDINNSKYTNCVENGKKGAEYGKKGGRPKKTEKPQSKPQEKPQSKPQEKPLNDNDNDNDNDNEYERDTLSASLSQFKNFKINVESVDQSEYDIDKICKALQESEFLQERDLQFVLKNYDNVIGGKYKTFKRAKPTETAPREFENQREYTKDFCKGLYADVLGVEI